MTTRTYAASPGRTCAATCVGGASRRATFSATSGGTSARTLDCGRRMTRSALSAKARRRTDPRDTSVERAAVLVLAADDLHGLVDRRVGGGVADQDHVARGVHQRRTADHHPVDVAHGIEGGSLHEVVPLPDAAKQRSHLGGHRVGANDLGVDHHHHQHRRCLYAPRDAEDGLGIPRSGPARRGVGQCDRPVEPFTAAARVGERARVGEGVRGCVQRRVRGCVRRRVERGVGGCVGDRSVEGHTGVATLRHGRREIARLLGVRRADLRRRRGRRRRRGIFLLEHVDGDGGLPVDLVHLEAMRQLERNDGAVDHARNQQTCGQRDAHRPPRPETLGSRALAATLSRSGMRRRRCFLAGPLTERPPRLDHSAPCPGET